MDPNTLVNSMNTVQRSSVTLTQISTILTIFIGFFIAWTAFQQHKLSKAKFKLDLFEKRYPVYKATQRLLSCILREAKIDIEKLFEFRGGTQDAVFLFDNEIPVYLKGIDEKAIRMQTLREELEGIPVGDKRSELCKEKGQLLLELTDELPKLKVVFGKYLKFKKWK